MLEDQLKPSQEPKTDSTPAGEPEIFVMPDLGPLKTPKASGKKFSPKALLLGGGGILIIGLAVGAFFLLRTPKPKASIRPIGQIGPISPIVPSPAPTPPPAPTPATTTPFAPPPPPKPAEVLAFGPDDDSDGITNLEERLIYKSDSLRPDTDNDGFLDGNEVFHLYSPSAPTPVALLGAGLVNVYDNNEFKYSIFYPADWVVTSVSTSTTREVVIKATTGELVTLTASDNPDNHQLFDWYTSEVGEASSQSSVEPITTKGKLQALQNSNRLTTYIALPGKVLVVSLNIGDKIQVEYRRTYEMMLNSLVGR